MSKSKKSKGASGGVAGKQPNATSEVVKKRLYEIFRPWIRSPELQKMLEAESVEGNHGFTAAEVPSIKTCSNIVKNLRYRADERAKWSPVDGYRTDDLSVELMTLSVLRTVIFESDGRKSWLSTTEATMIQKIATLLPNLPTLEMYLIAHRFLAAGETTSNDLTQWLAFQVNVPNRDSEDDIDWLDEYDQLVSANLLNQTTITGKTTINREEQK